MEDWDGLFMGIYEVIVMDGLGNIVFVEVELNSFVGVLVIFEVIIVGGVCFGIVINLIVGNNFLQVDYFWYDVLIGGNFFYVGVIFLFGFIIDIDIVYVVVKLGNCNSSWVMVEVFVSGFDVGFIFSLVDILIGDEVVFILDEINLDYIYEWAFGDGFIFGG